MEGPVTSSKEVFLQISYSFVIIVDMILPLVSLFTRPRGILHAIYTSWMGFSFHIFSTKWSLVFIYFIAFLPRLWTALSLVCSNNNVILTCSPLLNITGRPVGWTGGTGAGRTGREAAGDWSSRGRVAGGADSNPGCRCPCQEEGTGRRWHGGIGSLGILISAQQRHFSFLWVTVLQHYLPNLFGVQV